MHERRIVHMDIKPNNIMFSHSGRSNLHVKIIDFGLARELGGLGRAKCGIVGTVRRQYVADVLRNKNILTFSIKRIYYIYCRWSSCPLKWWRAVSR